MKFRILSLFVFAFGAFAMQAQDASQYVKTAGKALTAYNLNQSENKDKLEEAKTSIDAAFAAADLSTNYKANLTRAKINTELIANDYKQIIVNPQSVPQNSEAGVEGVESIKLALSLVEKKFQTKEVLKVLGELAPYLSSIGNQFIGLEKYKDAYKPLLGVMKANSLLTDNGEKSVFETTEDMDNHKYVTAVCAQRAGNMEVASKLLTELYKADSKEIGVYSALYNIKIDDNEEEAMEILRKGQDLAPDNVELLFAEINYYIKQEQFDVLEQKLKVAIDADPTNPSIHSALGNVYMNLSEQSMEEGDEESRLQHFNSALSYYNETLKLDENSFDAHYSIGSLYFNQAAEKTKIMQDLTMSKEDQARYSTLEVETTELFAKALPYFKTAERINPNDLNTVIALKEIFARQDDFDSSNEFKSRLETLQSGGQVDGSFFE